MEINKVYSGFRLDRIERIDEINGTAYEMKHEKSGARLIYIDSPDSNKVFNNNSPNYCHLLQINRSNIL